MKLLLVDDEEDIRLVASVTLQRTGGFQVSLATNGKEAMEIARKEHPDVILLDFVMPDIDDPTLLKMMRQDEELRRIPIIFLQRKPIVRTSEISSPSVPRGSLENRSTPSYLQRKFIEFSVCREKS